MANCKLTKGISISCDDKKLGVGGIKRTAWVFNRTDATLTLDTNGTLVTTMAASSTAPTYGFLYRFELLKGGSTTDDGLQTETGIPYFPHSLTLSTLDASSDSIKAYEEMVAADELCVVVQTGGGQFRIFGVDNGLTVTGSPRESGVNAADGTSRLITLSGDQASAPKILLDTDAATTLALLESLEATGE